LAQYRELAAFAQFGSDLDDSTKKRLERGKALTELLKQPQYSPVPVEEQIAKLWLGMKGYLDQYSLEEITNMANNFIKLLLRHNAKPLTNIRKEKKLSPEVENILDTVAQKLNK
jgi:F-type H+/Na+-transporting ATPase subunit alpha